MAPDPVTHAHRGFLSALGPLALALLLLLYVASMLALSIYFFGLQPGLWLSAAFLAGGVSLVVVLAGANRNRGPAPESTTAVRATPPPSRSWVPPRTIPFQ